MSRSIPSLQHPNAPGNPPLFMSFGGIPASTLCTSAKNSDQVTPVPNCSLSKNRTRKRESGTAGLAGFVPPLLFLVRETRKMQEIHKKQLKHEEERAKPIHCCVCSRSKSSKRKLHKNRWCFFTPKENRSSGCPPTAACISSKSLHLPALSSKKSQHIQCLALCLWDQWRKSLYAECP